MSAANGANSTIAGGFGNTCRGVSAMVPGGTNNLAGGDYSFAAGRKAKANHNGAFVWADSTDADFPSTKVNEFKIRAGSGLNVTGNITATGTITPGSSRDLKEDIAELTLQHALDTVRALRPVTFRYKADKRDGHVGFIAEDVPELLATPDRRGIAPMDVVAV